MIRQFLSETRQALMGAVNRRDVVLPGSEAYVSFTFDDFPQSALRAGGAILEGYGIRATFYAAMGLMDETNSLGRHFCAGDLQTLLKTGHELGSHTFRHSSCRSVCLSEFEADACKGMESIEKMTGLGRPHHFSYPYGHVNVRAKWRIGSRMSSCRGICPGINESPVDLNLLRANSLYSSSFNLPALDRLLALNEARRGWLIFYTHDVSIRPSDFGCTPSEFESVVKLATKRAAKFAPVGEVIAGIEAASAKK